MPESKASPNQSSVGTADQAPVPLDHDRDDVSDGQDGDSRQPPRKRQRVRLSCLECRRRKLACDRGYPCQRCCRSGYPGRCTYDRRLYGSTGDRITGVPASLSVDGQGKQPPSLSPSGDYDRVRQLELEVAELKRLFAKAAPDLVAADDRLLSRDDGEADADIHASLRLLPPLQQACTDKDELRFYRGKEFVNRYFNPHSSFLAFSELTGLSRYMKETAKEWLEPIHYKIDRLKDREKRKLERQHRFAQSDPALEALLPSKAEADSLIQTYLDQCEQLHRIVHIPSFKREYAKFWNPIHPRYAAFTTLVLSMMSVTSCISSPPSSKLTGMTSASHNTTVKWIQACDEWQEKQSHKHRKLIHYQIACLVYLAKRVSTVKKKRFWRGAGALVQEAVMVGLQRREHYHMNGKLSFFDWEMRRRIWASIQEFDIQASFDYGLPTLLSTLHIDVAPPANLEDSDFDESTMELPPSRPFKEYTFSSYQCLSRQSLSLRLELSRALSDPSVKIDYDRVVRYTNQIMQEIECLPAWDPHALAAGADDGGGGYGAFQRRPQLAYTLLHIQLRQYILPLHQPYLRLRKRDPKHQLSDTAYYNAARDMVILHDQLAQHNVRILNFLREDALMLAVNLCGVTMLQPRDSTNMIMVNSRSTLDLLEKCLVMKEDRMWRCGNNEPWGYSIMCCALGLLKAHLGLTTPEEARIKSADRFLSLHYRLVAGQDPPSSSSLNARPPPAPPNVYVSPAPTLASSSRAAPALASLSLSNTSGFRDLLRPPLPPVDHSPQSHVNSPQMPTIVTTRSPSLTNEASSQSQLEQQQQQQQQQQPPPTSPLLSQVWWLPSTLAGDTAPLGNGSPGSIEGVLPLDLDWTRMWADSHDVDLDALEQEPDNFDYPSLYL